MTSNGVNLSTRRRTTWGWQVYIHRCHVAELWKMSLPDCCGPFPIKSIIVRTFTTLRESWSTRWQWSMTEQGFFCDTSPGYGSLTPLLSSLLPITSSPTSRVVPIFCPASSLPEGHLLQHVQQGKVDPPKSKSIQPDEPKQHHGFWNFNLLHIIISGVISRPSPPL